MQQDFWRRVEDLYYEVLASPPESRAAVLDRSSSGDAELRREVESLMAARENAGNFLAAGLFAERPKPVLKAPGTAVGSYVIDEHIGAGSAGDVYRASDAGIGGGMRVLDMGCGIGDVSLIAARLVGSRGHVVAIDVDGTSLATAQERARVQGLNNLTFVQSAVEDYRPANSLDAVTGRHILLHSKEPLEVLRSAWKILREGGVAVFQEFDFSVIQPGYPATPFRDELMRICRDFFCRATHGNMGTRLYHLFVQAGFDAPDCRVEYPIDGGADSPFYDWCAESVRSVYPHLEALGLVQKNQLNLDTLAQQLRDEVVKTGACFAAPLMVGGFARKR